MRKGPLAAIDAQHYAVKLFGDSIAANMFMLGFAVPARLRADRPRGHRASDRAERRCGRDEPQRLPHGPPCRARPRGASISSRRRRYHACHSACRLRHSTASSRIAWRLLTDYQDAAYAHRYEATVRKVADAEHAKTPGRPALAMAAAKGLYKLMAYKDEYEVGRLYTSPEFKAHARRAVLRLQEPRVPSRAAAAGAQEQGDGRAAQDALRAVDADGVRPARQGQVACAAARSTCSATRPSAASNAR